MRRHYPILLALSLVWLLTSRGVAAPSAERPGAMQPILAQDARLDRKVTLRMKRSPLSAITVALGRQAGVEMTAAADVADEPAIVYAADQSAKEVMHHLATLFNYRWTRKGKHGEYRYEIYQDLKSKQEEEALRQRDRLRALEGLRAELFRRAELARRSPEELIREAEALDAKESHVAYDDHREIRLSGAQARLRREMAYPPFRALLHVVTLLTPEQWDTLIGGETLSFATRPEPGSLTLPPAVVRELLAVRPVTRPPSFVPPRPEQEEETRRDDQKLQEDWARAEAIRVRVSLDVNADPANAVAHLQVNPSIVRPTGSPGPAPYAPGLSLYTRTPPNTSPPQPAEPPSSWAGDPVLGAKRPLKLDQPVTRGAPMVYSRRGYTPVPWLSEFLPRIAEAYGINLVADAYRHEPFPLPALPAGEERTLYEALNQFVLPRAPWSKAGDFIHVRHRDWYHARLAEIPDRLIRRWTASLREHPRFSLDDAAALVVALRDEQLESFETVMLENGIRLGVRFYVDPEDPGRKDTLRAYGRLSPAQRPVLRAGGAVPYAAMPAEARLWLRRALQRGRRVTEADPFPAAGIEGVLSLADRGPVRAANRSGVQMLQRVEIRYRLRETGAEITWTVTLPEVRIEQAPAAP